MGKISLNEGFGFKILIAKLIFYLFWKTRLSMNMFGSYLLEVLAHSELCHCVTVWAQRPFLHHSIGHFNQLMQKWVY